MYRCSICSDAATVQLCCGGEGTKSKGRALDLPVDLPYYSPLWSRVKTTEEGGKSLAPLRTGSVTLMSGTLEAAGLGMLPFHSGLL